MPPPVARVAILGDRVPGYRKHDEVAPALERAAAAVGIRLEVEWIPSERPGIEAPDADAVVVPPQSAEYCRDVEAVIESLARAREAGLACLAICGGAQLALRGFARTLPDPDLADRIVRPTSCSLPDPGGSGYAVTGLHEVRIASGTLTAEAYGTDRADEPFECGNVLDPDAEAPLVQAGVRIAATAPGIGPAVFEWPDHPFFVATLFLPQWSPRQPHPLMTALARRAAEENRGR